MDAKFRAALQTVCNGEGTAALTTITRVKGSTPRKPGAKMLLLPNGLTFGTIGGGCGEAEVRREALSAIDCQTSTTYWVNMTNDMAEEEGMVCGGIMEVFIDVIGRGQNPDKEVLAAYLKDLEKGEQPVLVTIIKYPENSQVGSKLYVTNQAEEINGVDDNFIREAASQCVGDVRKSGKTTIVKVAGQSHVGPRDSENTVELLIEPAPAPVELLILGGGHIALPLATMAKMLGYQVSVVDDRPGFANLGRFPGVDRVICEDFSMALEKLEFGPETFVVIVTRGHTHDKICLKQVVARQTSYIGMIGSRRRVKALMAELEQEGIRREVLSRVHSPIGLDIGAETPEEIAIGILAELIKTNRGGKAQSLKLSQAELQRV